EAFPSLGELKQLVMNGLGLRIEPQIAVENRTHDSITFDLIEFAERNGHTNELIEASARAGKKNRALRAFLDRYESWRSLIERLPDPFEVSPQSGVSQIYERAAPPGRSFSERLARKSTADYIWALTDLPTKKDGIKHLLLFVRLLGQELFRQHEGDLR